VQQVRCRGCRQLVDRGGCLRYGLGYVCNLACAQLIDAKRKRSGAPPLLVPRSGNGPSSQVRAGVRRRDGHRCRWCGSADNLHVHHVRYRSEGGPNGARNLITLCGSCHDRAHSDKGVYQPVLIELLRRQYEEAQFLTVPQLLGRLKSSPLPGMSPPTAR
jgi:HNH endonuclease